MVNISGERSVIMYYAIYKLQAEHKKKQSSKEEEKILFAKAIIINNLLPLRCLNNALIVSILRHVC